MNVNKRIATAFIVALIAGPFVALAESAVQQNSQITTLYAQLVILLRQIAALQQPGTSNGHISISSVRGVAPFTTEFKIKNADGTESIIFGDGGYTGQTCVKKANGWCDLSGPVLHTYQYPGEYAVLVYRHTVPGVDGTLVSTSTVVVTN